MSEPANKLLQVIHDRWGVGRSFSSQEIEEALHTEIAEIVGEGPPLNVRKSLGRHLAQCLNFGYFYLHDGQHWRHFRLIDKGRERSGARRFILRPRKTV